LDSHTQVPGEDDLQGFGGACLPKDTEAFVHWSKHFDSVQTLVESAIQYNNKVRKKS